MGAVSQEKMRVPRKRNEKKKDGKDLHKIVEENLIGMHSW